MGARRQTGKQTSRDFDTVTPEALPEPSILPFPSMPLFTRLHGLSALCGGLFYIQVVA